MTYKHYLRNLTGKRLTVPTGDVSYVYQSQRKRRVKVEITGPTKAPCRYCGTPFLFLSDGRGRYPEYCTNACKQKAYRERERKQQQSLKIQGFDTCS
jgi:hypothetical protein